MIYKIQDLKNIFINFMDITISNNFLALKLAMLWSSIIWLLDIDVFGVSMTLILLLQATIFGNTLSGICKSKKRRFKAKKKMAECSSVHSNCYKRWQLIHNKSLFQYKKLMYVFWKSFSFLFYLFFANVFINEVEVLNIPLIFDLGAGVALYTPLLLFWYSEFKSIGDNTRYLYGRKSDAFKIIEMIFEPKWLRFRNQMNNEN